MSLFKKKSGQCSYNLNKIQLTGLRMDAEFANKKKIGYALLIIGLCLIAYVIGSVLFVFTGLGDVPVEFFKSEQTYEEELEKQLESMDMSNSTGILDMSDYMNDMYPMFNLTIWLTIAFLLLFAGYFLCKLGLAAMKPTEPTKPKLRKNFSEKNYNTTYYQDKVESGNYSTSDHEDFENNV